MFLYICMILGFPGPQVLLYAKSYYQMERVKKTGKRGEKAEKEAHPTFCWSISEARKSK